MSFWKRPTDAAKKAVVAPMKVTNSSATGESWNMGEQRQTRNTPAVTMVAAWIRAETGVGPSMASGSQVCSPSWADLPIAPTNKSRQSVVRISTLWPAKMKFLPTMPGAAANTASKSKVLNTAQTPKMPSAKPKSPTRLTMKALIAAALAEGRVYQKPISRYDARPTPSQPKNSCRKLLAVTSISMAKVNSDRNEKKRGRCGSSAM